MPNECCNTVTLTGPAASIINFKQATFQCYAENCYKKTEHKQADDCNFQIGKLYPCPIDNTIESNDAYNWRCENWGCPGIYSGSTSVCDDSNELFSFKMDSPWAPPLPAFAKISKDFPDITFEISYWGLGSGFCGDYGVKNGEELHSEHYENDEYDAMFEAEKAPSELPERARLVGDMSRIRK